MADQRPPPTSPLIKGDRGGKRQSSQISQDPSGDQNQPAQDTPQPPLIPSGSQTSFQLPPLPTHALRPPMQKPAPPKIAIPRIRKASQEGPRPSSARGGDKHRIGHACEPCRHRKTKCSGERPICKHCEDFKISCYYADGKRDRVKKEFGSMAERLENYESVLQDLQPRVDAADQVTIQKVLEKETGAGIDDTASTQGSTHRELFETDRDEVDGVADGESVVSAGVGSTGSLDRVGEDFNRNSRARATGFLGKNSEATWMQGLQRQAEYGSSRGSQSDVDMGDSPDKDDQQRTSSSGRGARSALQSSNSRPELPLSEVNYQCDDMEVTISDQVDAFELPPKRTADALFAQYLDSVHPTFPVLRKVFFVSQYNNFFTRAHTAEPLTPGHKWLAILNLIFAIGAKYSHLIQAEWRGDERDHLIFFTRARLLGMNADSLFDHPDLQQVQITGLVGFYLMSTNQINRAWNFTGIALRFGVSLGLNLRNEDKSIQDVSKEIRFRVWWSVYSVERLLCVMTGRPSGINDRNCTAPLPIPIEEVSFDNANVKLYHDHTSRIRKDVGSHPNSPEISLSAASSRSASRIKSSHDSPSSASTMSSHPGGQPGADSSKTMPPNNAMFFLHHTQLSMLSHEVLIALYSPGTNIASWAHIERDIRKLDDRLESWYSKLPISFEFKKDQRDQAFARQRMSLAFFYYSVKIIVYRPSLCRIDRRIPHESGKSKAFNRQAAAACVHAARDMLELLPDYPNAVGMYKITPWWCLLHYLAQAAVVLILEVSFRSDHVPVEAQGILEAAKKAVFWMNQMSEESVAARRSWRLCSDMLHKVAPRVGGSTYEMPPTAPQSKEDPNPYVVSLHPHHSKQSRVPTWLQQSPDRGYYGGTQPTTSSALPMSFYSLFDMYSTYDEAWTDRPEQISSMFPSSMQMQTMGEEEEEWPPNPANPANPANLPNPPR